MKPLTLNLENFTSTVTATAQPVLVDFWAECERGVQRGLRLRADERPHGLAVFEDDERGNGADAASHKGGSGTNAAPFELFRPHWQTAGPAM